MKRSMNAEEESGGEQKRRGDESSGDEFDHSKDEDGELEQQRKRRRGLIEKKRRDRINNSLAELRRLVPNAQDKSAGKVEKAELLRMTVDYIRHVSSKPLEQDGEQLIISSGGFRQVGFSECMMEIRKYLAQVEGMDFNDALHQSLLTHLQASVNDSPTSQHPAHSGNLQPLPSLALSSAPWMTPSHFSPTVTPEFQAGPHASASTPLYHSASSFYPTPGEQASLPASFHSLPGPCPPAELPQVSASFRHMDSLAGHHPPS